MEFKVSVITSLYNYKKYICYSIDSFLKQNFLFSEMIIVDDGSTDGSADIVHKYIKGIDPSERERIRLIRLSKNYGYSKAKNEGIKASKSEILVMLDADDMLTKKSISIRYDKIVKGFDFVHGPVLDYNHRTKTRIKSRMWTLWKQTKSWKYVHAQAVMLRKEIHRKIGLYDESLWCKSDREMFARIFNHKFKIGTVNDFVSLYRRHPLQMHKSAEKLKNNNRLQKKVKKKIEIRKKDLTGLIFLEQNVSKT